MVMGTLIGLQRLGAHQFDILEQHFHAMRSNQFVASCGMELVDSYKNNNKRTKIIVIELFSSFVGQK